MTKKMVEKYETYEINDGTRVGDIVSVIMKIMEEVGPDAIVANAIDIDISFSRIETDAEYAVRLAMEERCKNREIEQYKKLKEKYGHLG